MLAKQTAMKHLQSGGFLEPQKLRVYRVKNYGYFDMGFYFSPPKPRGHLAALPITRREVEVRVCQK